MFVVDGAAGCCWCREKFNDDSDGVWYSWLVVAVLVIVVGGKNDHGNGDGGT